MLTRRVRCHACGTRSSHIKTKQFCCDNCQAWNFLDNQGNYIDPPRTHVNHPSYASKQTSLQDNAHRHQEQPTIFCSTCLQNQQIYTESLANYLPDESHPQYAKFEKELPAYKRQLEQRYPQICKRCAPKAQAAIHDADYYSMTSNAGRLMTNARSSRRSASPPAVQGRDDRKKLAVRSLLRLLSVMEWSSILYQVCWHVYNIFVLRSLTDVDDDSLRYAQDLSPKLSQCLEQASRSAFNWSCADAIGSEMPKALLISAALLWYNPELKKLFHATTRYISIKGQREYLIIAVLTLLVRAGAYFMLSAPTNPFRPATALAIHSFVLLFLFFSRAVGASCLTAHRWRVEGSIMPRPEERDILGRTAGPAQEKFTPYSSPTPPAVLLQDQQQSPHFPIANLARQRPHQSRGAPGVLLPPSPPGSDYGDPMDIEPAPLTTPQTVHHSPSPVYGRHSNGWENMRTNNSSVDVELRPTQERLRSANPQRQPWLRSTASITPFRGHLPPAPSSQEKRLRNPVSQVPRFRETPVTQRQDFLNQMRDGIDRGRGFAPRATSVDTETSDLTTEARSRTRGQLDLNRSSDWHLPSDSMTVTGLEDIFGGSFQIKDPGEAASMAAVEATAGKRYALSLLPVMGIAGACFASLVVGMLFDVGGIRRPICLWLVEKLESLGC